MTTFPPLKPNASATAGAILLVVPCYFVVASLLRQPAPGLPLLGNPVFLLGTLVAALALNCLSITSVSLKTDTPAVVSISMALRGRNVAVISVAAVLLAALLGYAFLENFQMRPNS